MPTTRPRITIELDDWASSPSGHLEVGAEADRHFTGWLGLLAALGDVVDTHGRAGGAGGGPSGPVIRVEEGPR